MAVVPLYDEDSLPAYQSGGYQFVDGHVELFVPPLWLLEGDGFQRQRERRGRKSVAVHYWEGTVGQGFSFTTSRIAVAFDPLMPGGSETCLQGIQYLVGRREIIPTSTSKNELRGAKATQSG